MKREVRGMTKHTPGPWKIGKELSASRGQWLISLDVGNRGQGMPVAETRGGTGDEVANARLLAAAPDLLEACRTFAELISREKQRFGRGEERDNPEVEIAWLIAR